MTVRVSNTTQAQAAQMETAASKFESVNSSLQTMLSGLMANLEVLQTAWQGAGGRSFTAVKQQWSEDQRKINQALQETATAIRTSGTQYTATDEQAQSRVGATNHGGINLPL